VIGHPDLIEEDEEPPSGVAPLTDDSFFVTAIAVVSVLAL
jgi:hypothetical protein